MAVCPDRVSSIIILQSSMPYLRLKEVLKDDKALSWEKTTKNKKDFKTFRYRSEGEEK